MLLRIILNYGGKTNMKYTLAELKRQAKTGTIEAKMTYNKSWENEQLPERLRGWRQICNSNSNSISFKNANGRTSQLYIDSANLIEFTDTELVIYNAGYRQLNAEEQKIMDKWKSITETEKYREESYYDSMTDCHDTYWQKVRFFKAANMEYLMGLDTVRGMKYEFSTGLIRDNKVRGEISIKYELRKMA